MSNEEKAEYEKAVSDASIDVMQNQEGQTYSTRLSESSLDDYAASLVQLDSSRTSAETEMAEPKHPSLVWANDFLLDNGRRPIQLAPHGGIVPIRRSVDTYPQSHSEQLYKPLISENQRDEDDIKHFYNADLASSFHHHDYVQLGEWPLLDDGRVP